MTSQSKRVNAVSGTGAGSGPPADTKNTRRRIHQKRTRNRNGGGGCGGGCGGGGGGGCGGGGGGCGGGGGGALKKTEDKPNPVIESSNPFFIAVCSPESYKPRMGGGRRHNEPTHAAPIRTKPNVFLRQPSRHLSNEPGGGGGGGSYPNQFIHHPRLQNERQRCESSGYRNDTRVSVAVTAVAATASVSVLASASDVEQFPSLSSASSVLNTTKLNFKEMVMKNTNTVSPPETIRTSVTAAPVSEKSSHTYLPVVFQKSLSLGNIFSSVFYGGGGDDDDDDGDEGGGGGGGGGSAISSVLVDSCDRKYDNLYKY